LTRQNSKGGIDPATLLGAVCLIASGAFWFPAQWKLTGPTTGPEQLQAMSMGLFMTIGPSVIISLFVPWSKVGKMLARLHLTGFGQVLGVGLGLFLLYYAYQLTFAFWAGRPVIEAAGLEQIQTMVGLIATVIVPALLWAPAGREELAERMKTAHLLQSFEDGQKARIRELRIEELRIFRGAVVKYSHVLSSGVGEFSPRDAEMIAGHLVRLVKRVDGVLVAIANDAEEIAGTTTRYHGVLGVDPTITENLEYIGQSLRGMATSLLPDEDAGISSNGQEIIVHEGATTTINEPQRGEIREVVPSRSEASQPVISRSADDAENDPGSSRIAPGSAPRRANYDAFSLFKESTAPGVYWMAKDVAAILSIDQDTARRMVGEWQQAGWVVRGSINGRYRLSEESR
jgi:hypothetical protein